MTVATNDTTKDLGSLHCKYSNGKCRNPRSRKRNGTIHSLCEFHRQRACSNQRKLDRSKRQRKLEMGLKNKMVKTNRSYSSFQGELVLNGSPRMNRCATFDFGWLGKEQELIVPNEFQHSDVYYPIQQFSPQEIGFLVSCFEQMNN